MIGNLLRAALFLFLLAVLSASAHASAQTLALVGGSVYASPDAAPLPDAVVITSGGVITAIGSRSEVQIPVRCARHRLRRQDRRCRLLEQPRPFHASRVEKRGQRAAAPLQEHMREMLTRWGFTTRLGSWLRPGKIPCRCAAGSTPAKCLGPISTVRSIFPKGGHPIYLPPEMQLLEAGTPEEATNFERTYLGLGLDGVKLFTGSFKGENNPVVNMDPAIAKAAVDVAHAQGKPVFAHPQNMTGVDTVIAAGVDAMAHTVAGGPVYSPEQLARFKQQGIALIPTLALFSKLPVGPEIAARLVTTTVNQLKAFSDNGGPVLFGTDVGFTTVYDTTLEYELMRRALSERQILASLTTNPAQFFKAAKKGRVEKGFDADIVVLDGDPVTDVRNLAKVAWTIRAGKVIYQKP